MTWIAVTLISSIALALAHSPLEALPGVVTILLMPGAAVLSNLQTRPAHTAGRIVLSVCLSMMVLMVVGAAASLLGPPLGIAHPLNALPQYVIWFVLAVVVLVRGAHTHRDPIGWIFESVRMPQLVGVLLSGLLVTLSILGVAQLNHSGNIHLAVFATVLDVLVLLAGVMGGWNRSSRWPLNTLLYAASLALLVSASLRGGHLFGWDVQQEFGVAAHTVHAGVWVVPASHDPYASMLSLTVLPTILHSLVKLRLLAFFQLVVPAILALLPVAMFSTVRGIPRWITSGRAAPRPGLAMAVVLGLIVSSVAFSSDLVSITRQAMAMTMLTALVMVLFDRTMSKRSTQVIIGLLIVAISFTHYTTSYLLAGILLCAWPVSWLWERGLIGTPRTKIDNHRHNAHSRKIINVTLVAVALVAAFGWNILVTRNSALDAPSAAVTVKGVGLGGSTLSTYVPPRQFERLLVSEFKKTASYIVPVPGADSVHLVSATGPAPRGITPALAGSWNGLSYLAVESLWVILGIALLYGLFRLGRRRSYEYSSDLVGLAVTGLAVGGFLRFSGTLASYYNPERAAIFTAILLAAPATLFLDDIVTRFYELRKYLAVWVFRTVLGAGIFFLAILLVGATGLSTLFFGGQAPASLSARDVNVQEFTVSTPEYATAIWLHDNVHFPSIVQSDLYGHLVLLSQPGSYDSVDEIVPPEVDKRAYIYLSTVNLRDNISQAVADGGNYLSMYRSNTGFFNHNFYVVYSSGATRVYH